MHHHSTNRINPPRMHGQHALDRHRFLLTGYWQPASSASTHGKRISHTDATMQQQQPIFIPKITRSCFPAWMAAIQLQEVACRFSAAIQDATYTPDPLLIRTLDSVAKAIFQYISTHAQIQGIDGNSDLHLGPLLRVIHVKLNPISTPDHEALELSASRTTLNQFENLE